MQFDDPVAKYLPEFAANGKQNVTIRELLTHYSGLPEDVEPERSLGPRRTRQGRRHPARDECDAGFGRRALHFKYSDINFITLGALVEELGQPGVYALEHIFNRCR